MSAVSSRWLASALVGLTAVAAGCSSAPKAAPPKAFCDAANRYEGELDHEQTVGKVDVAKQISIVQQMAENAPPALRSDAQTFLNALQRVATDPHLRDNPAVKRAVDNVNRYASNKCGLFNIPPD